MTTEQLLRALPGPLLRWFHTHARDLPWRKTNDPYRIWVSEIMLQQTRVAAVLGYYDRFLTVLPTVEALAEAPEDRLLKLWEGLGYYSRARNLQRAARCVAERGGFPETYGEWLELPGVGDYTASAVVSAAFGKREAAVDGNVLRVAARLTDCHENVLDAGVKRRIRASLQAVMPEEAEEIRLFNQAVMELGALVCVPNGPPKCQECPVEALCLGRKRGTAEGLPVRAKKKERRVEEKTVFLLLRQGRTALRRRPERGLLAGLWEFPNLEGQLEEGAVPTALADWGLSLKSWREKLTARHIFTHVEWRMTGYVLEVSGEGPEDFLWADGAELADHAVPSAFARYYGEAKKLLAEEER